MNVILKYCDSNGHNFGVMTPIPNLELAEHVFVALPGQREKELSALSSYKKSWSVTLRSRDITSWLRNNYLPGQQFSATLEVDERDTRHHFMDITPLF